MPQVFLTPSTRRFLASVNAEAAPVDDTPAAQRAALDAAMAAMGWSSAAGRRLEPETIGLPSGAAVYLYRPAVAGAELLPLAVYCHGGGFVAGGVTSHAALAQTLADASGAAVALVDYRLAPEHGAPAALEDCVAAVQRLQEAAKTLRLQACGPALVGDSAGGALATGAALSLRRSTAAPRLLLLINPMITPISADAGSILDFANGYFASARDFASGWAAYDRGAPANPEQDLLSVADLSGLPPLILITNDADPVRDQGESFARRVSDQGGTVLSLRAAGLVHAAWLFPKAMPEAALLHGLVSGMLGWRLG